VPAAPGAAPVTEVDQELEQLKKRVRVKI
jgi:hypothetical protein